jgi:hypothetical protein
MARFVFVFIVLALIEQRTYSFPFSRLQRLRNINSFSVSSTTTNTFGQDLSLVGTCLMQISPLLGLESLREAGNVLNDAGEQLTVSWKEVANELEVCAHQFVNAASECDSKKMNPLIRDEFERISFELQDASEIDACLSIAPLAAAPNFESIGASLWRLLHIVETENDPTEARVILRRGNIAMDAFVNSINPKNMNMDFR